MNGAAAAAGEPIAVDSVPNLRDAGGLLTRDSSSVRRTLVYRSVALNGLADGDVEA